MLNTFFDFRSVFKHEEISESILTYKSQLVHHLATEII